MSFHARRFNRSARDYESEAGVQARMAERLLESWGASRPAKILELGCGTGILARLLRRRFPDAFLLATDAAPAMLVEARARLEASPNLEFAAQDASGNSRASDEVISLSPFNTACSNALIQWFPDLRTHLRFVSGLTGSGGYYHLSSFTQSNFPELNALLREPPFSYGTFPGHEPGELRAAAADTGWNLLEFRAWEEKEVVSSAREVLRRIRALGSSRDPREGGRLNRRNLENLLSEYGRRFSEGGGVRMTWKPWVARLERA